MPKLPLSSDNKSRNSYDFTKLWLDQGERARVLAIETTPEYGYTHTLRAPQIVNGVLMMETVRAQDGTTTEKPKYDFVGRHLCPGDLAILTDRDSDPDHCLVCRRAQESDAFKAPERRFAMNVIRYKVQPGGWNVADPFQADCVVWQFTNKYYDQLVDAAMEWGDSGGLQKHDLQLGPCSNKYYQNYDIKVAEKAAWLVSDAAQQLVTTVYKNGKIDDLTIALGRRLTREQIAEDVNKVLSRYEEAFGKNATVPQEVSPRGTGVSDIAAQMDVAGILGEGAKPQAEVRFSDAVQSVVTADQPSVESSQDEVLDLDKILGLSQ